MGICNGFQILCESGLLPGVLTRNRDLKFICENANVKVENVETPFTKTYKKGRCLRCPLPTRTAIISRTLTR